MDLITTSETWLSAAILTAPSLAKLVAIASFSRVKETLLSTLHLTPTLMTPAPSLITQAEVSMGATISLNNGNGVIRSFPLKFNLLRKSLQLSLAIRRYNDKTGQPTIRMNRRAVLKR